MDRGEKRLNNPRGIPMFSQGDKEEPAKVTEKKCPAM